jgi:ribosomal protein S18 acetylase RimI-like enzyme
VNRALERFWRVGLASVAVDLAADNPGGRRLYESLGFRKIEEFVADEHCREAPRQDKA